MKSISILSILLLLSLYPSLSASTIYRYNGKVQLMQVGTSQRYVLQFCSVTCPAKSINNSESMVQTCEVPKLNICRFKEFNQVESILKNHNNSCNKMITLSTSSNSAISSPITSPTSCTATVSQTALGAMVAILTVMLAIVSTGWVCTCWAMKKRRRAMNINKTNIR